MIHKKSESPVPPDLLQLPAAVRGADLVAMPVCQAIVSLTSFYHNPLRP
ncbi:hypothetical protein HFN51_37860 [Rhizobium leguminosarum]|nr:hypothetical protein [Rhizobium leguminosarum]